MKLVSFSIRTYLDSFEKQVGKLDIQYLTDYSGVSEFRIEDLVTNERHSFSIDTYSKEDFIEEALKYHLSRIEDQIYMARGKHLSKSYNFYKTPIPVNKYVASKDYLMNKDMYYDDYEKEWGSEYDKLKEAEKVETLKKELEAKLKAEAAEAKRRAERKKAYDENEEFGSF